jgi:putative DNA primase/helicase
MMIPAQLREWRFILLTGNSKIPIAEMLGWAKDRENKTFTYDDSRLQDHIAKHGNYGVVTGTDRFVVAADTKEVEAAIEKNLPRTFTVQSPRHKTKHFYFYGKLSKPILCNPSADGDPCADIRYGNAYVLGPGDTFKTYGEYRIIDDEPIATITEEQLIAAIGPFLKPRKETKFLEERREKRDSALEFPITKILPNLEALTQNGEELFGPHPLHGSTTGSNFHVNLEKNVWHCFRAGHDSGGGPLELLAVLNGLIQCEDCHKGALRGDLFKKTMLLAKEKGLIKEMPLQFGDLEQTEEKQRMEAVVTRLRDELTFKTVDDTEKIHVFNEGVYEEAETMIKGLVEQWLGIEVSKHFLDEVLGHIERGSYVKRSEFNKAGALIPVQNGLLDLNTEELSPFDKDKIFTFKSNLIYNKTKKSTKFLKAVNEWVDPQDVPLLQEISGYCLLPGMPFHHLFFLHGTGFNGKGSYIRTLQAILGKDHCSNLSLEEFDGNHRFAMARLYGKMINVSSEPRTDKDLQTSLLKKACGEDYIDAEEKNKQKTLNFMNTAKPFILGNKYPKVNDNTLAFWERVQMMKFISTFTDPAKNIPTIWNTWINDPDEMSGIFNWMLEGLKRLLKNNGFTKTKSSTETKIEFQKLSDTTGAFLDERCEHFKEGVYIKRDLYETYKEYCDAEGLECDQLSRFSTKMNNQTWIKNGRIRIEGKLEHVWIGLKVKASSEDGEEKENKGQQKLDAVPPVPPVPPSIPRQTLGEKKKEEEKKLIKGGTPGTGGTPAPGATSTEFVSAVSVVSTSGEKRCKTKKNDLKPSDVKDASLLEANGESVEYKQQNQTAYVAHIVTGEPCYRKCGLASEWRIRIGPQFGESEVLQLFCTECWNKAKKDLERSGFKVVFEDAGRP